MSSSSSTPRSLTPQSTGLPDTPSSSVPSSLHISTSLSTLPTSSSLDTSTSSNSQLQAKEKEGSTYKKPSIAFYPHVNSTNKPQKPFSRSAAKRESVMALGSIEHLQHYFTKTGIAARKDAQSSRKGLVPALGPIDHTRNKSSIASLTSLNLPPSPAIPNPISSFQDIVIPPHVRTIEVDPENLRPGVIEDLRVVERMWFIREDGEGRDESRLGAGPSHESGGERTLDVLGVLKATTRAVRAVRNYLLSLPDEHDVSGPPTPFRPSTLPPGSPKRRLVSRPDDPTDPLTLIRRSALEVLATLRALEEACRIPLSDDAYDASSDRGPSPAPQHPHPQQASTSSPAPVEHPLPHIPSRSNNLSPPPQSEITRSASRSSGSVDDAPVSVLHVPGRADAILVWEEEEDEFREEEQPRAEGEHWDQRLVLGSGWLYRQDVTLRTVEPERKIVERYLDAVDGVLFRGSEGGRRGWEREAERLARREGAERKGRRVSAPVHGEGSVKEYQASTRRGRRVVSTGMLEGLQSLVLSEEPGSMHGIAEEAEDDEEGADGEGSEHSSIDDDDLPPWARRSFSGDRTHALLSSLLPPDLSSHLPPPSSPPHELWTALSSGQLLCVAYNVGVRRSRKPWGYIARDGIHDIVALEAAAASGTEEEREKERKGGWTFRRTDNLRLWAAALKIRYMLPLVLPAAPLPVTVQGGKHGAKNGRGGGGGEGGNSVKFPKNERPIYFDARAVARREEGWEDMLRVAVERWVRGVVEERRGDSR
ncbi:unnamed protein product [Peniophora sp. CBMAI 1063]|nr:unnamed protein product [Peniophora sp. CBMAI 1063]